MALTQYQRIVNKLGTQKALAELAGQRQQTVAYWKKAGFIPAKHQPGILAKARAQGLPLDASDFLDESKAEGEEVA